MPSVPSKDLSTFPNPAPERDYEIAFDCPEFTCLCPLTGQPDFAHFRIRYVPDKRCIELKSLKLYLWAYRNEGAFHEAVTNQILGDLVRATSPPTHDRGRRVLRPRGHQHQSHRHASEEARPQEAVR